MTSLVITGAFIVLTLLAAIPYWILACLASWNGPASDYGIGGFLFIPILLHALLISKSNLAKQASLTLVYAAVVTALCWARYWEILHAGGFGRWFANTSLVSLLVCSGAFALGFIPRALKSPPGSVRRLPKAIKIIAGLWIVMLFTVGSYLHAYRRIELAAIPTGRYSTSSKSSLAVFQDGHILPQWCVKFRSYDSRYGYPEFHASLLGHVGPMKFAKEWDAPGHFRDGE